MEHLAHYEKEERPWGTFERFTQNEATTVKIITVHEGEALSLQTHAHRDEFWRILSGTGTATRGTDTLQMQAGDTLHCPRATPHRMEGGKGGIVFLEIAFGDFDEGDIVRLEDRYNRA